MSSNSLLNSIETIFAKNNSALQQAAAVVQNKKKSIPIKDLELALTVLLVELASCDQTFEPQEYNILQNGLRRMFGTSKHHVQALVNQATVVLKNLRGTSRFGDILKKNLDQKQREAILEIVEEIISADGVQDGFEIYTRNKIATMLELPVLPLKPADEEEQN
ncbi:MAG: TerB family tellurite resistance protein [Deltaproteobacteria bacterium]|nr:TerB family tellurite resistance protein [Deltaproteobacteria bacterium]